MKDFCWICGKPESEHHIFASKLEQIEKQRRPGCICEINDEGWIPHKPICDEYKEDIHSDIAACENCEHLKECHKK